MSIQLYSKIQECKHLFSNLRPAFLSSNVLDPLFIIQFIQEHNAVKEYGVKLKLSDLFGSATKA